eukprot:scaffold1522_cov184-Chaetoceros_neogracile.AAC.2
MDGSPTSPSVENKKVDDVLVFDTQSDASKHKDWFHIVSTEGKSSGELSSRSDILLPTKISTDTGFRRRWFRMGNPRKWYQFDLWTQSHPELPHEIKASKQAHRTTRIML